MKSYKKKICVVTGSRAEYGILKNLISKIKKSKKLNLKLLVTGMHLSSRHGLTYKEFGNSLEQLNMLIEKLEK